jgi:hypothetical protein
MKLRSKIEKAPYVAYLTSAISEVEQAIDSITYTAYPELNKRTIDKLQEIIDLLDKASVACIFKP